ncbi:mercuric resistance operon regulatory protein MerR [Streptococcus pneumoniae]|uniref:mercury resistance transcriptional regulator MerR2 n=1 Tax=Enterococcus casseliflavus TaxID=37734 RepID=UPI0005DD4AD4|nr:mercury resistance transcriptional regulator MerR2 [Enterococcus casseliflavus]COF06786.1 mercuric resistance operon regulatory protein MerR [Streptococcus pneumoniae]QQU14971.1 mercury resistance transcriptional regulator MerR2 [Enterococcus casseliflavus]COF87369.1 mercuric resistance operon regulatory protein MerR [Streptococcus pneumoniae]COQ02121.1 mercuric resistance operon regulatory protein MerR [Streptococcus pneumoniae]COQ23338.1 mercuric resistance operon regulatory protein MerR 
MEDLTIGQLAQQTGVSRKAIRLYEEKELILPSIKRSEGNYRVYNQEHVFCINGIKQLRSLGVSLEEMKELIVIFEKNTVEVEPHLQHLLKKKLIKIDEQINELQKLRKHIVSFLDTPKESFNQMEGYKQ